MHQLSRKIEINYTTTCYTLLTASISNSMRQDNQETVILIFVLCDRQLF